MICKKCKKEVEELFTNDKWEQVCKECMNKEIYKERKRVIKNERRYKNNTRKINE